MKLLIKNIYEAGGWPNDFTEVTMTVLKEPKATKYSKYHTSASLPHCKHTIKDT
jgi:hypothetical protein